MAGRSVPGVADQKRVKMQNKTILFLILLLVTLLTVTNSVKAVADNTTLYMPFISFRYETIIGPPPPVP